MELILEFIRTDAFLISILVFNIVIIILLIALVTKISKTNKNYEKFIKKLGNGNNIEEILRTYINQVEIVNEKTEEVEDKCKSLENILEKCIKKVGIVRYSAYKDTGSDLSFALALLNDNNDGVVLNGIYSREMSNIYAKPIERGISKYTISEEEKQAIEKAINS